MKTSEVKVGKARSCIVIPNWNGVDFLGECLDSLREQTVPCVVAVVEQGSVDGSRELLLEKYPDVWALLFDDNQGFTGGVNRGIVPALEKGFEFVVLFNNDAVADKHYLEKLEARADRDPKVGIIASKILHTDKKHLDSTGDFYTSWGYSYPRGRGDVDEGQFDSEDQQVLFGASGGASMYRTKMLKEIGVFDERFFAYFEDIDISFRAQLAGWRVAYEPDARVYHRINATSSRMRNNFMRYHTLKNFIYVYTKNMPGWLYWKYLPKAVAGWGMMAGNDVVKLRFGTTLRATGTALKHLPGILRERHGIQKNRRVKLSYIDGMLDHELPPIQRKKLGLKDKPEKHKA